MMVSNLISCATSFYTKLLVGIIILTTNRAKSIDGAVQSRIHLAIQYHDLKPEQRLAIYKNRLKVIPDDELEDRATLEKQLEHSLLAKKGSKVNGRQIRNIVTGARMLAKSKNEGLSLKHLTSVHDTTSEFISSMADLMQRQRAKNDLD
jgi:AAA+ superfamily predicted ATPase